MAVPCPPEVHIEVTIKRWQDLSTSLFHLLITIGATENIDKNLFVYKQLLDRDATTGCFISEFEAVATLPALAEFAVDVPNTGQVFFRKNSVELTFSAIASAEETEDLILADLRQVVADREASPEEFQSEVVIEI
jgi:hypothetical protein